MDELNWHSKKIEEAIRLLESNLNGLSEIEAESRLNQCGPNELREEKKISPWKLFFKQFRQILIIILLFAIIISASIGEIVDALVIFAIVFVAVGLGFFQEYRAEKALEALKKMAAPIATVIRAGKERAIPARELVPGDLIRIRTGDIVPADSLIIDAINLQVNEAALTGESVPVNKKSAVLPIETQLAERFNLIFAGTTVTLGHATALVFATGMNTEFGKIAKMVQITEKVETPIEIKMEQVGKFLAIAFIAVISIIAILGFLKGHRLFEIFLWAVSLAVAAVPEALPAVVTGSLAIGVYRMAKKNAIVRRLPAVETLGSTTVICSDKTGTLTTGEMTVRELYVDDQIIEVTGVGYEPKGEFRFDSSKVDESHIKLVSKIAALCNDSHLERVDSNWQVTGDPTEGALLAMAGKAGIWQNDVAKEFPRVGEVPFTSERKCMTTIHCVTSEELLACTKGAPEVVLEKCTYEYLNGKEVVFTQEQRNRILDANEKMASKALRLLGIAYRRLPSTLQQFDEGHVEKDLVFVGLVGMMDPPREEVMASIRSCKEAGVKVIMITGDHKLTAVAIAKELNLVESDGLILTGKELDKLSDIEFEKIVENVVVYARVSPEHKMRIVKALKEKGHIVAMTGDGINDAPALKNSNVGIAMGITGTDVTKEASHIILADDNFSTIVAAIEEGRGIYDNVKKYLTFLLSVNIGEILVMFLASIAALPLPLLAKQILWINLATDGLPALALGVDPAAPDVMKHPPRSPKESVFSGIKIWLAGISALLAIGVLFIFSVGLFANAQNGESLIKARTMTFATVIIFELLFVFSCRSFRHSVFELGLLTNKYLVLAVVWEIFMLAALINVPFLRNIFGLSSLSWLDWFLVLAIASTGFIASELGKIIFKPR
ncbi:MAG: cation-translocating P-type ATPase [Euryarchaeota archaeon]|nr:cation-translocating P-type ATPase [Euryarchaeota archaeon]